MCFLLFEYAQSKDHLAFADLHITRAVVSLCLYDLRNSDCSVVYASS